MKKPLPLLRLSIYLIIVAVCGTVAGYELYFALAGETTMATIVSVGKVGVSSRTTRYWADYEYFDTEQTSHVGREDSVPPATNRGDKVEVQFLRHAPRTSRIAPAPGKGLIFGAVALLAAAVFVAELVLRRRRRSRKAKRMQE